MALTLTGTAVLRIAPLRGWGFLVLTAGAFFGAVSLRMGATATTEMPTRARTRSRALPWIGVGLATAILLFADVRRFRDPNPVFGVSELLWALSMLLFLASAWFLGDSRDSEKTDHGRAADWVLFSAVVLVAFATRLVALREIPFAIFGDEFETGHIARQYFLPWRGTTLFTTVWRDIDLPALWFSLVAGSLKLFGPTLFALRFPAALFGALTNIPVYALAKEIYGRRTALLASALLAASAANIHFSRFTLNNITAGFFWTLTFAFLVRGLRTSSPFCWAAAGISGGLGEHFYYATRLLPFVLGAFLVYLAIVHARRAVRLAPHALLLSLGYLVGFGPLLSHFLLNPGLYLERGRGVLAWRHIPTSLHDLSEMAHTLAPPIVLNGLGLSTIDGSSYGLYTAPLFTLFEAALLAIGLAMFVRSWRNEGAFLVLLASCGVVFVGGTLVPPQPAFVHWTPALACLYVVVAAPIAGLSSAVSTLPARPRRIVSAIVVFAVLATCCVSLDFYFRRYVPSRPELEIRAAQARLQAALGSEYRVRVGGETWQPYDAGGNGYLLRGQDGANLKDPDGQLPLSEVPGKKLAFFFFRDNESWLARVRAVYPGGRLMEATSRRGAHFFFVYLIPGTEIPPAVRRLRGLVLSDEGDGVREL